MCVTIFCSDLCFTGVSADIYDSVTFVLGKIGLVIKAFRKFYASAICYLL